MKKFVFVLAALALSATSSFALDDAFPVTANVNVPLTIESKEAGLNFRLVFDAAKSGMYDASDLLSVAPMSYNFTGEPDQQASLTFDNNINMVNGGVTALLFVTAKKGNPGGVCPNDNNTDGTSIASGEILTADANGKFPCVKFFPATISGMSIAGAYAGNSNVSINY